MADDEEFNEIENKDQQEKQYRLTGENSDEEKEGEREDIEKSSLRLSEIFFNESEECDDVWRDRHFTEEYGGEGLFDLPIGEGEVEYPPVFGEVEYESEHSISVSTVESAEEFHETEEEKAVRIEREQLIESIKLKLAERTSIRRKNIYLHRKLVEHFKKRKMEHIFKEDPKGFELEAKYLKRLFAFQEFKENQDNEINELTEKMDSFKNETEELKENLYETLNKFIQRQKELSLNLILTKTGKKLNEKIVDRLLRRQLMKCEEKGKLRLKYVKLKNLIEDKEKQLKAMENIGDGLHIMDYEQMKIDNQNYTDKIEEKEEELSKLRMKTHGNIQNLAQVREKAYAIEGDIELMETKYEEIKAKFNNKRELVSTAKKRRDALREEFAHLKKVSGLLTRDALLRDFENSIDEKEKVCDILEEMKSLLKDKKRKHTELNITLKKSAQKIH